MKNRPVIFLALAIQGFALAILALGVYLFSYILLPPYPLWGIAITQGILATLISWRFRLPTWWLWIQCLFPIALYIGLEISLNPLISLFIFIFILLVFSNVFTQRVPLYLTNRTTQKAFAEIAKDWSDVRFLDVGSGLGHNVAWMAQQPNVTRSVGVETAPLLLLVSKALSHFRGGDIQGKNLWHTDLSTFNLVYAFLSPTPMPELWQKVVREMPADSVFVSNSFAVPDVEPSEVWRLSDKRATELFIYKLNDFKNKAPQEAV